MKAKPEVGSPCNGCGVCCQSTVCSVGSKVLGLVDTYGERAAGPCPALRPDNDGGYGCGLVMRPKDFIASPRGVTPLRDAVKLLIGAGAGCDEAGDEPDATFVPKAERLQRAYIERHGIPALRRAVEIVVMGR